MRIHLAVALAATALLAHPAFAEPVEYVRVCDAEGTGYMYVPGTEECVDPRQTNEGVAMSLALPGATIDPGKSFGAGVNLGTFNGESAVGFSGAFTNGEGLTFNGGVGVGLQQGTVGGRAGVNYSW